MSIVEILTEIPEASKNVTLGWNQPPQLILAKWCFQQFMYGHTGKSKVFLPSHCDQGNLWRKSPDVIFIQLEDEEIDETDEDELEATGHSQSTDQRHEYYRQPVFLTADKCPYLPHVLHFVRLATGTVLVLVCEVRN